MTAQEIRRTFLEFFKSKGHKIVPSAPIVNKDDPTLMFTNAGMNQFKDYFLGNQVPEVRRVADTQKCLRVSGKHNDLEEVGRDGYHHTMFEMLGNWSFGDYFKKEAIAWSWELLTEIYKLPKDRLYATVFEGSASENLAPDDESRNFWRQYLPDHHIINGNKKDNFWEMGDTGPCGPCTEIHIDLRPDDERKTLPGENLVNTGDPRVIEIWNNVFIQFNRKADGTLEDLPEKHVDTGMGFERLTMVIQGKLATYDTDIFTPIIQFVENESGIKYTGKYPGTSSSLIPHPSSLMSDIAMRVIADHIRAVSFTIADGQLPGNTGAGYVIRRILRRAVRYYYSFLNIKEPFLYRIVPMLAEMFADVFPELKAQQTQVARIIKSEERAFLETLGKGIARFSMYLHKAIEKGILRKLSEINIEAYQTPNGLFDIQLPSQNLAIEVKLNLTSDTLKRIEENAQKALVDFIVVTKDDILTGKINDKFSERIHGKFDFKISDFPIAGESAFELYDTFGFPIDLTRLIAEEGGWNIDEAGFEKAMQAQKNRARAAAEKEVGDWHILGTDEVMFVGYDELEVSDAKVLRYRTVKTKKGNQFQVVLDRTPFYAESGGQHGDSGWLEINDERIAVLDTLKENELIVHVVERLPKEISGKIVAKVNVDKRHSTASNHSATHLMHAALHRIVGPHALQKGQDVDDQRLRFDFSHFQKLTDEEIRRIEEMVNEKIRENILLEEQRNVPIEEARQMGAMMLFGEKYGENVRVITFDKNFSRELCGGTHVQSTGQIGLFKILSESAVAAGVRRIEAVTAQHAEEFFHSELDELQQVRNLLKTNEPTKAISVLQEKVRSLEKQVEQLIAEQAGALKGQLKNQVQQVNGINFLAAKLPLQDANAIKTLAYQLESEIGNACIVFGAEVGGKPQLTVAISRELTENGKSLHAGNMVRELAKDIQGGGGGQPFFAQAGGKDASGLDRAIERARELV